MIGLIPFLVDDFAVAKIGRDRHAEIIKSLDLPGDFTFNIIQHYDDELCRRYMSAMVVGVAMPLPVVYDWLGVHFLNWMRSNLDGLFAAADTTEAILMRLPAVYNSIGGTAHEAEMPGSHELVSVRRFDDRLRVTYQSRARFAAFYASFMKAVAAHFNETIEIAVVAGDIDAPFCVFDVTISQSETSHWEEAAMARRPGLPVSAA